MSRVPYRWIMTDFGEPLATATSDVFLHGGILK